MKNHEDILKGPYSTSADKEPKTLTPEVFKEALDKLKPMPDIPEIWYSRHLELHAGFEFETHNFNPFIKSRKIIVVGGSLAHEMINQGLTVYNGEELMDYDEIDLEVVFATEDAVLLTDTEIKGWIPKSCIQNIDELPKWLDKGDTHTFEIATYQLRDKGFI